MGGDEDEAEAWGIYVAGIRAEQGDHAEVQALLELGAISSREANQRLQEIHGPVRGATEPVVQRLDFIEGLRGLAVGAVLIFHATIWGGLTGRPTELVWYGHAGVDLFFVISGFCMLWPVLTAGQVGELAALRFYARRFLRIAPPYLVAVLLAVGASAVMWRYGGASWWGQPMQDTFPTSAAHLAGNLATHATFTHGLFPAYDRSIDGAFWSLSTEWQFYVVLPLLILVICRVGAPATAALGLAVSGVYALLVHHFDPTFVTSRPLAADNIAFRLVEFAAGMLAAWLVSAARRPPGLVLVTVAALASGLYFDHWGPAMATPFAWAAGFGGLLLCCCWQPAARRVAEWGPVRALGRVSYSTYLIHGTVYMLLAVPLTAHHASHGVHLWLLILVGPPVAVAAATVLHRLVERPAMGWAHSIRRARSKPPLATRPS